MAAPSAPAPAEAEPAAARALREQTRPLVALIARLRDATPADPTALRRTLAAAVARFEAGARAAGLDEPTVAAASYLLCSWADEQVAATPWGAGGAGLLQQFHGEAEGGDKVLKLLSRLAEQPRAHHALLELFHTCLSLGLRTRARGEGERALETLRTRVHLALQQVAQAPALSPAWQCAPAAARAPRVPRVLLPALLLLGVVAFGVYSASQLQLAARVDGVLASLQRLTPARAEGAPPADAAAAVARLAPRLADGPDGGRIAVRDEAYRSVVVLSAESAGDQALIGRIGAALAALPGKVLVVATTDGTDTPSPRTPSAWHQAMEWARATADALRPQLGDERLSVEARVDPAAPEPRRRVEIVLFPL